MANTDCKTVIRMLNILCAIAIVVVAIYNLFEISNMEFWTIVYTCYWILFGGLILSSEFNLEVVLKFFGFLKGHCGKGIFLIFCGTWLISEFSGKTLFQSIIGCVLILCGFITMLVLSFIK